MKNKLLIASLLIVFVACALGFTYQSAPQKWEYYVTTGPADGGDKYDAELLNGVGVSGWELVSIERNGRSRTYFFKRQK